MQTPRWSFFFGILATLAALAMIFTYKNVTSENLRSYVAIPRQASPLVVAAIVLFVASFGLSCYGLYELRRVRSDFRVSRTFVGDDNSAEDPKYPLKVYVELINTGRASGQIAISHWINPKLGARPTIDARVEQSSLQLWLGSAWVPNGGVDKLWVPPGERCRLWITPDQDYDPQILRQRCSNGQIGRLAVFVNGHQKVIRL